MANIDLPPTGSSNHPRQPEMSAAPEQSQYDQKFARMQREVQARQRLKVIGWTLVTVLLTLSAGAGIYAFWCFFQVRVAQQTFLDTYESRRIDEKTLQMFAQEQWREMRQNRELAESRSWLLERGEICNHYERARIALITGSDRAKQTQAKYNRTLQQFKQKYEQAKSLQLQVFVPAKWREIEQLWQDTNNARDSRFEPQLLIAKMELALATLEPLLKNHELVAKVISSRNEFEQQRQQLFNEAQWQKNIPDIVASITSRSHLAESRLGFEIWQEAAVLYKDALQLLQQGHERITAVTEQTQAAVDAFENAMNDADAAELTLAAAAIWQQLKQTQATIQQAMVDFDYAEARQLASDAQQLLKSTQDNLVLAKAKRDKLFSQLQDAHGEAVANATAMAKVFNERWQQLQQAYQDLTKLAAANEFIAFAQQSPLVEQQLRSLNQELKTLQTTVNAAQQRFTNAFPQQRAQAELLARNVPEQWNVFRGLGARAVQASKDQDLPVALENYEAALQQFVVVENAFAALRTQTLQLQQRCEQLLRQHLPGLQAFENQRLTQIRSSVAAGAEKINEQNYLAALPLYQQAWNDLPRNRLERTAAGTTIDYVNGLMWISDINSIGSNNGETLDWYKALSLAAQLDFAGHRDWQLPSDEQLQTISRLPVELQTQAFAPKLLGSYWTRIDRNVDQALAVDIASGRVGFEQKRSRHHARPVRSGR